MKKQVNVLFDDEVLEKLRVQAERREESVSNVVRGIVSKGVDDFADGEPTELLRVKMKGEEKFLPFITNFNFSCGIETPHGESSLKNVRITGGIVGSRSGEDRSYIQDKGGAFIDILDLTNYILRNRMKVRKLRFSYGTLNACASNNANLYLEYSSPDFEFNLGNYNREIAFSEFDLLSCWDLKLESDMVFCSNSLDIWWDMDAGCSKICVETFGSVVGKVDTSTLIGKDIFPRFLSGRLFFDVYLPTMSIEEAEVVPYSDGRVQLVRMKSREAPILM